MNAIGSELNFAGRTVLVIGASRGGIGASAARAFRNHGATVSVTGIEPSPIDLDPGAFPYHVLDVADPTAVGELAEEFPAIDVVVNCAGMARRDGELEPDTFRRVLEVNLHGVMNVGSAFREALRARQGNLINVASMFSNFGSPRVPAYGASKAGVAQLTKSLAIAWAEDGVRVNAVAPGFIETAQTEPARLDDAYVSRVVGRTPMGRWGLPDDIAGPILFLASPLASFITGIVLPVDGGYSAS